jgi:hypothetical protein
MRMLAGQDADCHQREHVVVVVDVDLFSAFTLSRDTLL